MLEINFKSSVSLSIFNQIPNNLMSNKRLKKWLFFLKKIWEFWEKLNDQLQNSLSKLIHISQLHLNLIIR